MSQDVHVGFRQNIQGTFNHPHVPPVPIFNTAIMPRSHRLETFDPSERLAIDRDFRINGPTLFPHLYCMDAQREYNSVRKV